MMGLSQRWLQSLKGLHLPRPVQMAEATATLSQRLSEQTSRASSQLALDTRKPPATTGAKVQPAPFLAKRVAKLAYPSNQVMRSACTRWWGSVTTATIQFTLSTPRRWSSVEKMGAIPKLSLNENEKHKKTFDFKSGE